MQVVLFSYLMLLLEFTVLVGQALELVLKPGPILVQLKTQ